MAAAAGNAAEIQGPETIQEGQLLVLEGVGVEGNTRWILPDEYDGKALRTATQLALIPTNVGALEIILVTANGDEIGFARHNVRVSALPVPEVAPAPKGPPKVAAEVKIHEPKKLAERKTAKVTDDPRPMLIYYSMPVFQGYCPACVKWKAEEFDKLRGWTYAEESSGKGISAFPSFEVRSGGHSQFIEGYQTAAQLKAIAKSLEAL
jgi:hypothetical protein